MKFSTEAENVITKRNGESLPGVTFTADKKGSSVYGKRRKRKRW